MSNLAFDFMQAWADEVGPRLPKHCVAIAYHDGEWPYVAIDYVRHFWLSDTHYRQHLVRVSVQDTLLIMVVRRGNSDVFDFTDTEALSQCVVAYARHYCRWRRWEWVQPMWESFLWLIDRR
jgi:hypothetical protein